MPFDNQPQNAIQNLVGVIPAAGVASRLAPLPCSKELLQVRGYSAEEKSPSPLKAVSYYLLEKMRRVNVSKVYIILRDGKWDIPAYFGNGNIVGLPLAYLLMDLPFGVPYTVDQAYPFIKDSAVVFGFPDILFEPADAFNQMLSRQKKFGSDIVLGIFLADQPHKMDMVDFNRQGRVQGIVIKPSSTRLKYTWIIATWTPVFTRYLHNYVAEHKAHHISVQTPQIHLNDQELHLGHVIDSAVRNGIQIETVFFPKSRYLDIGIRANLKKAMKTGF
jgi:glucose-1-phosphate thymidylyltransferase